MSFIIASVRKLANISRAQTSFLVSNNCNVRKISSSLIRFDDEQEENEEAPKKRIIDPRKDRTRVIPVEISMKYLKSPAYKETYGDQPVWTMYRRNFKGHYTPKTTRRTCIRDGVISTGSPCPICRDEYLIIDYRNISLLEQFICPYTGNLLPTPKTGVCRKQYWQLQVHIAKAKDEGLMTFDVPFREYNYSDWYDFEQFKKTQIFN